MRVHLVVRQQAPSSAGDSPAVAVKFTVVGEPSNSSTMAEGLVCALLYGTVQNRFEQRGNFCALLLSEPFNAAQGKILVREDIMPVQGPCRRHRTLKAGQLFTIRTESRASEVCEHRPRSCCHCAGFAVAAYQAASRMSAPTASSLAWLRARAGELPALPFGQRSKPLQPLHPQREPSQQADGTTTAAAGFVLSGGAVGTAVAGAEDGPAAAEVAHSEQPCSDTDTPAAAQTDSERRPESLTEHSSSHAGAGTSDSATAADLGK